MSLYFSGNSQIGVRTFSASYGDADGFVEFLRSELTSALWYRLSKEMAHIIFTALFVPVHSYFTFNGQRFEFVNNDEPVFGGIPVQLGNNTEGSLNALGAAVEAAMQWSYEVTGSIIDFTVYDPDPTNEYTGNGLQCEVFPSGSMGIYDFNPQVIAGRGITSRGGFTFQSQSIGGPGIIVKFYTNQLPNPSISLECGSNSIGPIFDMVMANSWVLLSNRYQFFLYALTSTASGTFFFACHLKPTIGLLYANYACGPSAFSGGSRVSLDSIGGHYYLETPDIEYAGNEDLNEAPSLCFPGYGKETGASKTGNLLAHRTLIDELGVGFVYEPHLAVCKDSSDGIATNLRILGSIWDSVIYSIPVPLDSFCTIGKNLVAKDGTVVLSQDGGGNINQGSLCVLTEN